MPRSGNEVFGLLAILVGIVGYIPYYTDIFRGTTKPHPFTWFGFTLLNAVTFMAQILTGGGPGSWVTAVTTIATLGIALLALRQGETSITRLDWICFVGALLAIVLWKLTSNPLVAVVIVTVADIFAFAPTFRKAYLRPHEETVILYAMSVLKYGLSLFALTSCNFTTAFFPEVITILNVVLVVTLVIRRRLTTTNWVITL